jgi:hypothetical protein
VGDSKYWCVLLAFMFLAFDLGVTCNWSSITVCSALIVILSPPEKLNFGFTMHN